MHIYFLGIGGTGVGPLALIAKQTGYLVSGSDQYESEYTHGLQKKGINVDIKDPSYEDMVLAHKAQKIDWIVTVSAIIRQKPDHPVFRFARDNNIHISERDECLNKILDTNGLEMIAAAGTQGKTTTTAMFVWALKNLGVPESYSVGAKMNFADMGHYEPGSKYFVYECDEFHRNFLNFFPKLSVICSIAWDHHEVFPTQEEYNQAFVDFIGQSTTTIMWATDAEKIHIQPSEKITIIDDNDELTDTIGIKGRYNRKNARLVVEAVHLLTGYDRNKIVEILNGFPGTSRRMEEIAPNIYSDYAHTPEKITGCLSVASEIAQELNRRLVVVYEPLTNRRQHFMKKGYKTVFSGVDKLYWVPSYLAREDPNQIVLTPTDLIGYLDNPKIAVAANLDNELWYNIQKEADNNALVVCMSGGGGKSLDEWLRSKVRERHQ